MKLHETGYYHDGYKLVAYCVICGKEDLQLIDTECEATDEKKVDKKSEQT